MKNLTNQAKSMASSSASSVSKMKSQLKSYSKAVVDTSKQQEYLKSKIQDLEYQLKQADLGYEVGDTLKIEADIERLSNRLQKLQSQGQSAGNETSGAFAKIRNVIKSAISNMTGLGKKMKDVVSSSKNMGKGLASSFNSGIKSIKKFALSLLSVRTAFSMISRAMQSYLSFDTQLSNSIQNCWNVLGSLLAPILEYVVSLFSKLVSYVNAFVKALTGVDLVARANSKALDKQAKSTKGVQEAQSSLDELHSINDNSGGGDDNTSISVGEVDTSKLDVIFSWIDKVKSLLSTLFDPIKEAWENKGQAFMDSLSNAWNGIKNLGISVFSSIMEVWTNGTGQKYIENCLTLWTNIFNIVGALAQAISNAWNNAGNGTAIIQSIANIFNSILDFCISISNSILNWVMSDSFQQALNVVFSVVRDLFGYLEELIAWVVAMYDTYLAPVVDKILNCISKIIIAIGSIWEFLKPMVDTIISVIMDVLEPVIEGLCGFIGGIIDAISGILDFIIGVFTGDWELAWNGIKEFFGGIIDAIGSLVKGLCNTIGALFKGAWDLIKSIWSVVSGWFYDNIIKPVGDFFTNMWENLKTGAKNAWEGIKSVFSSVATFFKNIFGEAWTHVKNIFSTGGKIFDGIKEGIANAFKTIVNAIIRGINKVVAVPFNAINSALSRLRSISILDFKPFSWISTINVPSIPELATGGVATEETLVKIAEYDNAKTNPEIVSPKDMMKETFLEAIEESGINNQTQKVDVDITGKLVAEGDDLVYVYDKTKNDKGYNGGKSPSFIY